MHKRLRRTLSLLFLLTFAIAAPAVIITTAGYRYNFMKGRLERTGVLFVSTEPSGAMVELNGKSTEKSTSSRIKNLLPGTYHLRLQKEGYLPWERSIEIRSRQTTFLNNILLLRRDFPRMTLEAHIESSSFSPDRRYAAVVERGPSLLELRVIDLRTGDSFLPYRTENVAGTDLALSWSPDGERLLIERRNGASPLFFVWEKSAPEEMTDLAAVPPSSYTHAFWSEKGRFLYASHDGRLYRIDPRTRTAVDDGPSADAARIMSGTVYGLISDQNETLFIERALHENDLTVTGPLPKGDYVRLGGSGRFLTYLDRDASRLLLVDPGSEPGALEYVELRGSEAEWSRSGDQLLYWTPLELHVYDAAANSDRLITRLGKPLADAERHPRFDVIFYTDGEVAFTSDAGVNYSRGITQITRMNRIDRIVLDDDGSTAWLIGAIGGREGLWTLQLR